MKDENCKEFVIYEGNKYYVNYFRYISLGLEEIEIKDISKIQ